MHRPTASAGVRDLRSGMSGFDRPETPVPVTSSNPKVRQSFGFLRHCAGFVTGLFLSHLLILKGSCCPATPASRTFRRSLHQLLVFKGASIPFRAIWSLT